MKTIIIWFITFWMGVSLLPEAKAAKRFQTGEPLPSFSLPMPENPDQKAYLGLSGKNTFGISQINASIVIIEIFSMYCPHCQREAPLVNRLYERIQRSPELKEKVKLIGIGVGNSPFEVNVFRKRYKIPFPLFPDGDFLLHKLFGEVRTPFFMAVKLSEKGRNEVIYTHTGALEGIDHFLNSVLKNATLEE